MRKDLAAEPGQQKQRHGHGLQTYGITQLQFCAPKAFSVKAVDEDFAVTAVSDNSSWRTGWIPTCKSDHEGPRLGMFKGYLKYITIYDTHTV